jgi:carbonic anhydrase
MMLELGRLWSRLHLRRKKPSIPPSSVKLRDRKPDSVSIIEEERMADLCRIEESVKEDVEHLRSSPFILPGTSIVGLKMDTFTGVVTKVTEAQIAD